MSDSKANRVFNNHELLGTICTYLTQRDCIQIACSSRLAFGLAAPRIWKTLKSVQPLLMLLSPKVEKKGTDIIITLLPSTPSTFERFDLYSPFVRSLTISKQWAKRRTTYPIMMRGWPILAQRVQLGALLPNLLELKFSGQFGSSDEVILWMSSFVSPSLQTLDIRTPGQASIIPLPDAITALAILAQKCPELQILGHNFKLRDATSASSDRGAILQMVSLPVACDHLRSFQHLSRLWILGNFINPESLVTISQLAHLRTLGIDQTLDRNGDLPHILKSTRLCNNSFPALSELDISFDLLDDFLAIWGTKGLAQNIGKIHLKHHGSYIFQENTLVQILSTICERSPRTKRLTLEDTSSNGLPSNSADSVWSRLAQLPLSHLKLVGLEEQVIEDLPALPELVALDLPDQWLELTDLMHLSRFPKLEKLSTNICYLRSIPEVQPHSTAPLRTVEIPQPLDERLEIDPADKIARYELGNRQPLPAASFIYCSNLFSPIVGSSYHCGPTFNR
ncbi:hypothetical protein FRC10_008790 [Ceratobasidium sp. 414]|nr:hypothetical protein FRC10_008790 [Ceratobasidium sp. 414]